MTCNMSSGLFSTAVQLYNPASDVKLIKYENSHWLRKHGLSVICDLVFVISLYVEYKNVCVWCSFLEIQHKAVCGWSGDKNIPRGHMQRQ